MVKSTRRGFAGDDVTETEQFEEDVTSTEDESYVVVDTDSPHDIEVESTTITDDHRVVTKTETGDEEDFLAESEEGSAEVIDEDGESREGNRRGESVVVDEDGNEEDIELPEPEEETEEDREGSKPRRGTRSRKGSTDTVSEPEVEDVVELVDNSNRRFYGGKSPVHQDSIRAAVEVAMRDRRL